MIETFGDLFAGWLQRAKPRLATWADEERRYRLHLQRALGRKSLGEVSRDDIANIRDRLFEDGTPIESNRVVALFNRVMNFGVEERHLGANPGHRLRKLGEERARSRHLKEADLRALWLGLERAPISLSMADALRLLILLGQRRGELIGAHALELRLTRLAADLDDPWRAHQERTHASRAATADGGRDLCACHHARERLRVRLSVIENRRRDTARRSDDGPRSHLRGAGNHARKPA